MKRIKVVGAGGIGGVLLPTLARYLNYSSDKDEVVLTVIDGDTYEPRNRDRQSFHRIGNKAEVTVEMLKQTFPDVSIRACGEFVTPNSVEYLLAEGDTILLCVDNHKTRKLVSDFCRDLDSVVLISGGNEYTDGNIQVYVRKDGVDITLPLANKFHPEIQKPRDKSPHEIGCGEEALVDPQLLITNFLIAALMLNALWASSQGNLTYDEVYACIVGNNCRAVVRR